MKKFKSWIIDMLKGIGIGFACMVPGVSGGTFAIITKVYDKIINAISDIFKNFIRSILILLPIGIGCALGLLGTLVALDYAFDYILFTIICLFAGLIIGSVPCIFKEVKSEKVKGKHVFAFLISFLLVIGLAIASFFIKKSSGYDVSQLFVDGKWYLYIILIPVGAIAAIALVAPGISGSMIMLVMGFYTPVKDTLLELFTFNENFGKNLGIIACFAVGILLGFYFVSKLMKYLLANHKVTTYWSIIGFIIGSVPALFINNKIYDGDGLSYKGLPAQMWELPVGIVVLIAAAVGIYFLMKFLDKKKENA